MTQCWAPAGSFFEKEEIIWGGMAIWEGCMGMGNPLR